LHSVLDLRFVGPDDETCSSESEPALLVETHSINYDVRRTQDGVRVTIRDYQWKKFLVCLVWTIVWALAAAKALSAWDRNAFAFFSVPFCALLAGFGACTAVTWVLSHTLIFSPPSELRVRSSFLGLTRTRLFDRSEVIDFGFGYFGHSRRPVLRLEVRALTKRRTTQWIVLAHAPTERDVDAFIHDVEAQGLVLPHNR
jgi:hypothetical protein